MYPYPWGPPFHMYGGPEHTRGPSLDDVMVAKKWFEELEKSVKDQEEKKKVKKHEPKKFNFLEVVGILLLTAPVLGSVYIYCLGLMLNNIQDTLKAIAPH